MEKRLATKDSELRRLEMDLRETKWKYEMLLNNCAKLAVECDVLPAKFKASLGAAPVSAAAPPAPAKPE